MVSRLYDALMRMASGDEAATVEVAEITGSQSKELNSKDRPSFTPLHSFQPVLSSLSVEQSAYYEWWKTAWLAGAEDIGDESADAGYALLLAGEVLEGTVVTPLDAGAVGLLSRLAAAQADKGITRRISLWAADLAWELGMDKEAAAVYRRYRPGLLPSLAVYTGAASGWSPKVLTQLSRDVVPPSRFMEANRRRIVKLFREALVDGDAWFRQHHNIWLADALGRRSGKSYTPYKNMPLSRTYTARPLLEVDESPVSMKYLLDFLKAVENVLRSVMGLKSMRRVGQLPDLVLEYLQVASSTWPTVISVSTSGVVKSKSPLRLRRAVLRRLTTESRRVRHIANRWVELGDKPFGPGTIFDSLALTDIGDSDTPNDTALVVEDNYRLSPSHELTTLTKVSDQAAQFIAFIGDREQIPVDEADTWARSNGVFLSDVVDEVNLAYFEELDGPLLVEEDSMLKLTVRELLLCKM